MMRLHWSDFFSPDTNSDTSTHLHPSTNPIPVLSFSIIYNLYIPLNGTNLNYFMLCYVYEVRDCWGTKNDWKLVVFTNSMCFCPWPKCPLYFTEISRAITLLFIHLLLLLSLILLIYKIMNLLFSLKQKFQIFDVFQVLRFVNFLLFILLYYSTFEHLYVYTVFWCLID